MSEIRTLEEQEELVNDINKLRQYEREIKLASLRRYDELHSDFVDEILCNGDVSVEELELVRKVFEYIKSRV